MAEVRVLIDCVWRGGQYMKSGKSQGEKTIVVLGFVECSSFNKCGFHYFYSVDVRLGIYVGGVIINLIFFGENAVVYS